ncbi:MAG: hypothetical protein M3Z22_03290, partial [Verrucomicrobiota bacterium]|nr:hypothetical protein [Verrucomicrobiota bacterium]
GLLDAMQGMAANTLVLALVGFSGGVEIGHQVVVLPLFALLRLARRSPADPRHWKPEGEMVSRWASVAIALAGCVYFFAALRAA